VRPIQKDLDLPHDTLDKVTDQILKQAENQIRKSLKPVPKRKREGTMQSIDKEQ
jgi:hypothetical protein